RAADSQASFESWIQHGIRLGIGHVNGVIFVDEHAARTAELFPLINELAILIEDLDAAVCPVGDEEPSAGIHRDAVRRVHLARGGSLLTPRLDEFPVLREFHNTSVAICYVSVSDENVSV